MSSHLPFKDSNQVLIEDICYAQEYAIQYFMRDGAGEIWEAEYNSILEERSSLPNPVIRITARQGVTYGSSKISFNSEDEEILSNTSSCVVGYLYQKTNESKINREWAIVMNKPVDSTQDVFLTFVLLENETITKTNYVQRRLGAQSTVIHTLYPSPLDDDKTQQLYMKDCEARFVEWRSYHKSLQGSDYLARLLYGIGHYAKDEIVGYDCLGYDMKTFLASQNTVISNSALRILQESSVITWAFSPNYLTSADSNGYNSSALLDGRYTANGVRGGHSSMILRPPMNPAWGLESDGGDTQVGGESIKVSKPIPPIYLDKRLPIRLKHNKASGDYYINQVRCTVCGQRVIVSLNEGDMPPPTLNLKCPECKKKGLIVE